MKLLMLGWELPPYNSGGLGVACYNMAKALADKHVSIDFVLPYTAAHPEADWMEVHCASAVDPESRSRETLAYTNQFDDVRATQAQYVSYVEEFAALQPPEAIHAHDWLTMEAGMRAKQITSAPLIVHVHATEYDRSGGLKGNPLIHDIEYQGLMMADRIIAVSRATKAIIVQKYGIPADKIDVAHNAVDAEQLAIAEHAYDGETYKYLESLKKDGYCVVATMTRFTVQKGLTQFIKAAARACEKYERFVFLLAGDGEQRDELMYLAAEYGIGDKVLFTGFVRGRRWRDTYSAADVFVMSSVSEPFGLTALEAAHHDNALIITNQSGVNEVLNSIYRYDFWDTDRLADQLVGIATSDALRDSLQKNVKKEYNRFNWDDVAAICMKNYQQAIPGVLA